MKKIISLLLIVLLLFSSCGSSNTYIDNKNVNENTSVNKNESDNNVYISDKYTDLSSNSYTIYLTNCIYENINNELPEEYFIENVETIYISKEYIEELEYNSKENIFFRYSLSELEAQFTDSSFVFYPDESGNTNVKEFEKYDNTYEKAIRNVCIGSGVILVCITVSVITGGTAPAVSVILAASAKTGAIGALTGGLSNGIISGIITGVQTKDFDEAKKAALLSASEGFMWGAVCGSIAGGANKALTIKNLTLNGLTMNEAAMIQKESGYPLDVIRQFKSVDEYNVYKNAGLTATNVDGKIALVRNIDLNYISELPDGTKVTNLERMANGYAPIDSATGKYYQLHHINQDTDGTLAILTESEHQGNSSILNIFGKESEIDRTAFETIRKNFWKAYAAMMTGE